MLEPIPDPASIHPFFWLSILKRDLEIKRTISNKKVCLESLVAMVQPLIINAQEKKQAANKR